MTKFDNILSFSTGLPPSVCIVLVLAAAFALLWLTRHLMLMALTKVMRAGKQGPAPILVEALRLPLTMVIAVLLIILLQNLSTHFGVGDDTLTSIGSITAQLLLTLALIVFLDRLSIGSLERYSDKSTLLKNSNSLIKGSIRIIILGIGVLVMLGTLGISVTPIIASLGIVSLAVALALQPTLENFFSGVQLIADKPIRVGDFIELESGEQGFVEKIGWRSTRIKMLPNNIIIMPNSVLAQSKLINYYYPVKELSVPVEVGVHYDSDLEFVEQVTLDVARHILKTHKWGVPDYETFVVYHTFDQSSINFTVMLRAQEYFNRFFIKSEFIKALHARYRQEGIVIPYPIRALNTQQESPNFPVEMDQ